MEKLAPMPPWIGSRSTQGRIDPQLVGRSITRPPWFISIFLFIGVVCTLYNTHFTLTTPGSDLEKTHAPVVTTFRVEDPSETKRSSSIPANESTPQAPTPTPNSIVMIETEEEMELGTVSVLRTPFRLGESIDEEFHYEAMPDVWYSTPPDARSKGRLETPALVRSGTPARALRVSLLIPLTSKRWSENPDASDRHMTDRGGVADLSFWQYTFPTFLMTAIAPRLEALNPRKDSRGPGANKRSNASTIPAVFTLMIGVDDVDPVLGSKSAAKQFCTELFSRAAHLLSTNVETLQQLLSLNYIIVSPQALFPSRDEAEIRPLRLPDSAVQQHRADQQSNHGSPTRVVNRLARGACLSPIERKVAAQWDRQLTQEAQFKRRIHTQRIGWQLQQTSSHASWRRWRGFSSDLLVQINDDVLLLRSGWIEAAVASLDKGTTSIPTLTNSTSSASITLDSLLSMPEFDRPLRQARAANLFVSTMQRSDRETREVAPLRDPTLPSRLFGLAGLRDPTQTRVATQTILPCIHLAAFGTYFNPYFVNWHSDDHLNALYYPSLGLSAISQSVAGRSLVQKHPVGPLPERLKAYIAKGEASGFYTVHLSDRATQRYDMHTASQADLRSRIMHDRTVLGRWLKSRASPTNQPSETVTQLEREVQPPLA